MIGLFFGETNFPKLILKKIKKKKLKYFIIDLSKNNIFKNNTNSYRISIGQFGKILKLIREQKCKKVIFAGKINKPKFSSGFELRSRGFLFYGYPAAVTFEHHYPITINNNDVFSFNLNQGKSYFKLLFDF